jgi:hypothetical protein
LRRIKPVSDTVKNIQPPNFAERLVIGLLWLFLMGFGWFDLLNGGISLKGKSGAVAYASGNVGLAIAAGAFVLAALVSLMLARTLAFGSWSTRLLLMAVLAPPLFFVLPGFKG